MINNRNYRTTEILNERFNNLVEADKNSWIGSVQARLIVKNSGKYCSNIEVIDDILDEEYETMAKEIVIFLRSIFPSMIKNRNRNNVIMIEALNNNPIDTLDINYGCKALFYFSCLDENDSLFLFEYSRFKNLFLPALYHSKNPVSLYFGVFAMNYDVSFGRKLVQCRDGRNRNIEIPRILSNESSENKKPNSLFTESLFVDFDNCSKEDFEQYYKTFKDINIEPSVVVFTGHGYQMYWTLSEKLKSVYNTAECSLTEAKMTLFKNTLLKKGFDIDTSVYNTTRLLRLPSSWNCKEYKKKIQEPEAIKTYVLNNTGLTYEYDAVIEALELLPGDDVYEELELSTPGPVENRFDTKYDDEFLKLKYKNTSLNRLNLIENLETPIKVLLMGFQKGHTNGACMVIPEYLRINYGFKESEIIEIMLRLYDISNHITEKKETIINYAINNGYGYQTRYKDEFEPLLGKLEENSTKKKANVIRINNSIFDYKLSQNSFYILMLLYMKISISLESVENTFNFSINNIVEMTGLSIGTVRTSLSELKRLGILCYSSDKSIEEGTIFQQTREKEIKRNADRTKGIGYLYTINQFNFKINPTNNYTDVHVQTINAMLKSIKYKEIKSRDMMIALYLLMKCYNKSVSCYPTQEEIADILNLSRPSVISSLKVLEKENFITRVKNENDVNRFMFNYSYSLDLMKANL